MSVSCIGNGYQSLSTIINVGEWIYSAQRQRAQHSRKSSPVILQDTTGTTSATTYTYKWFILKSMPLNIYHKTHRHTYLNKHTTHIHICTMILFNYLEQILLEFSRDITLLGEKGIYDQVWRRQWHPTPVFLPGESQGRGSLVGCHLWGRTESDTTKAT